MLEYIMHFGYFISGILIGARVPIKFIDYIQSIIHDMKHKRKPEKTKVLFVISVLVYIIGGTVTLLVLEQN